MSTFLDHYIALVQDTLYFLNQEDNLVIAIKTPSLQKKEPLKKVDLEIPKQKEVPAAKIPEIKKPVVAKLKPSTISSPPPKKPKSIPTFQIENSPALPPNILNDIEPFFKKIAPDLQTFKEVPDDLSAKRISEKWKYKTQAAEISILSLQESPKDHIFLTEIAHAIDNYFYPSRVIATLPLEKNKGWGNFLAAPQLKLIIICDYAISQLPDLLKHYKEYPSKSQSFLAKVPLFMLPDLSLYYKDGTLKRSLWKALCQKIKTL